MTVSASKFDQAPLVSVLIPCYNHEDYIIDTLESVAASDYKSIEIVFIDDGSKDNSFNLSKGWLEENRDRFVRAICVKHEVNCGICETLNELFALSHGQYLNYLASDDKLLPDGLTKQVNFAIRNGVDFVFSDLRLINEEGNLVSDSAIQYFGKNANKLNKDQICLSVDIIFAWGAPWNKSFMSSALVRKIGPYDENLLFEDRDFALRVLMNGSFALMLDTAAEYRIRMRGTTTPGLVSSDVWRDFRKADYKNYLKATGLVKLLLGIQIYSHEESFEELGIRNSQFVWLTNKIARLLKRLILKIHRG